MQSYEFICQLFSQLAYDRVTNHSYRKKSTQYNMLHSRKVCNNALCFFLNYESACIHCLCFHESIKNYVRRERNDRRKSVQLYDLPGKLVPPS